MQLNNRKRSLIVVGMVCIALIMGMYSQNGSPDASALFGDPDSSPYPEPTYTPYIPPTVDSTPIPTRPPAEVNHYINLNMFPETATPREEITGQVTSDVTNADVTIQYFRVDEGIQSQIVVHLDENGYGVFYITLEYGEWHFWGEFTEWTIYGEWYSNSEVINIPGGYA